MKVVLAEAGVNCHPALSFYLVCCLMSRGSVLRHEKEIAFAISFSCCCRWKGFEAALRKQSCGLFLAAGKRRREAVRCGAQTDRERSGESIFSF